ncbi:MAG: Tetratricopeptide repeat protein, partial [Bacteroidota bacterium]|nr:Tetratricopeptide repeat protein [Bacteroidota bacterium]
MKTKGISRIGALLAAIAAIAIFSHIEIKAQWVIMTQDADSLVRRGSDYIYNCRFNEASDCFHEVIKQYPEHPAGYFLDAMVEWWKMTIYRDQKTYDNAFLSKIEKVLILCNKELQENPKDLTALFFKGGALGYRGRYYATRQSWMKAASDAKDALDIMMACYEKAPGNHDIMLGTGLYNYFAIKLPEEYPLLAPVMMFLPRGDKSLGILQLWASSRYSRYTATEAKVVLQEVFANFEKDNDKAMMISEELYTSYPDNPYFHRMLGRCYVIAGYALKADSLWRDALNKYIAKKTGYDMLIARESMYYIGSYAMMRGDYNLALKYFYKCDEASRVIDQDPSGFMVKLNLKVGNIYDMQGKRDMAVKQYNKLL